MPLPLFLPCAAGVEALLEAEVRGLLPEVRVEARRGGVALAGNPREVMLLNLESRLAQRVLIEVAHGEYRSEDDLYALARSVDWGDWITPQQTLRVDSTAQKSPLKSLNFAALRIKDAVCDQLREATGERPSVDVARPDLTVVLHVGPEHAQVYVDSSGESLFKRGWRSDTGDAPLKETLAAAMLAAAGWRGTPATGGALHDPCCGSGTIAIEAAQIAAGIAPGALRRFACERLLPFTSVEMRAEMQRLRSRAKERVRPPEVPIFASDLSFRMVDFARRNAERAGVADWIQFNGGDALERPAPRAAGRAAGHADAQPALRRADRGRRQGARGRQRAIRPRTGRRRATSSPASPPTGRRPTPAIRPAGPPGSSAPTCACRARCGSRNRAGCRSGTGRSSAGCSASSWSPARRAARARPKPVRSAGPARPRAAARRTRAAPRRSAPAARSSRG